MMMKKKEILQSLLKLVVIVFAATVLGKIFTGLGFPETNIVVMYLLAVLLVARFTSGYQYGILSAVVSLLCYNYFFTEPYHTLAVNGKDGISYMVRKNADLILLDLGLPDMDGMEVLHKIREWSEVPIIIVSARDQDKEKASALDDGADDYLTKPFSATELMARIRVALRHYYRMNHSESEERPDDTVYVNGDLKLDNGAHIAYKDDKEIHLTPLEYQLLLLFMQNPGKVLTYHTILRKIWGEGYGEDTQVLRSVMASTQRKIERNPAKPEYIETEIGIGYRMREHEVVK